MHSWQHWVEHLHLTAYPAGGYFRETYRAAGQIPHDALPDTFTGPRSFATLIYFLLPSEHVNPAHRLNADETWHFYAGDPLTLHIFAEEGYCSFVLGPEVTRGEQFQVVVPAGCWFGATVEPGPAGYTLAGCGVAPGFERADYTPAVRDDLLVRFPAQRALIRRLTPAPTA